MREAQFVNRNKEKWSRMEQPGLLDADTLAANYVVLSDDLAYARTFYPESQVEQYLNGLVGRYQIGIYTRDRRKRRNVWAFG